MIRKMLVAGLLLSGSLSFAQSAPAAEGGSMALWAGAELSSFNPDWGCKNTSAFTCWGGHVQGIGVFADANRIVGPVGVEAEARWLVWQGPHLGVNETNYLIGPRYQLIARQRASLNVKVLAGGATFKNDRLKTWQGWSAFAPGATIGYRLSDRLMLRGDYEYQFWPGFVGKRGANGLTPNGFSLGVSYRLLR